MTVDIVVATEASEHGVGCGTVIEEGELPKYVD